MSNIHMTHAYIFLAQSYIFRVTNALFDLLSTLDFTFKIKADVYG